MSRRRQVQSLANIYDPEVVKSSYYYVHRILNEFDMNANLNSKFLSMFEASLYGKLIQEFFLPIQRKINAAQTDKEEYLPYPRHGRRMKGDRDLFDTLGKNNFSLDDLENDILLFIDKEETGAQKIQDFFLNSLETLLEGFDITQSNSYLKIQKTFDSLGLKTKYIPLIHFLGILSEFPVLNQWLVHGNSDDMFMICTSKLSGLSKAEIYMQTSSKSKFTLFGILEESSRVHRGREIDITSNFHQYLTEPGLETFGMRLVKEDTDIPQELSSFFLPDYEKDRLRALLDKSNSAKILLYGSPGTGKTEFAKSLAESIGATLLKIDIHDAEDTEERRAALVVGELSTRETGGILLMDEADDLLNEGKVMRFFFGASSPIPEKKIWMNEFLDSLKGRVIFITNEFSSIHESVRRRFDYSLQFFPADQKQREYYWSRVLHLEGVIDFFTPEKIKEFSEVYPVGVGGITSSIRASKKICSAESSQNFIPVVQDVITKHIHLIGGKVQKPILSKTPYDPSLLHTDSDLLNLETLIKNYREDLESSDTNIGSLCLLFYGKPGTGKTEYARYLSKLLEIELIQKRSSDLQSMWVGKTEKNIAEAFMEAEKKKSIFFLDEADSFFRTRELATQSYEGSQTNEFLTWMESFRGIFIASTNFLTDFDPAVLRRFAWKGEFKPLRREDKVKILFQYFPDLTNLFSSLEKEAIKDISSLTPGDYRAVWNRFRYRDLKQIEAAEIISALQTEASFKSENQSKIAGF
jgi:transitional endoplasmic reticulum ATPase